jgi:hypothetical protein
MGGVAMTTCADIAAKAQLAPEPNAVEAKIIIPGPAQKAGEDEPACGDGSVTTTGNVIAQLGASAIDTYIGYPVVSSVLNTLPPQAKDWLNNALQKNNGKSVCSTLCVTFPASATAQYRVGFASVGPGPTGFDLKNEADNVKTPIQSLLAPPEGKQEVNGYTHSPVQLAEHIDLVNGAGGNAGYPDYTSVRNASLGTTGKANLFCATGMNWGDHTDRWFIVRAEWQKKPGE